MSTFTMKLVIHSLAAGLTTLTSTSSQASKFLSTTTKWWSTGKPIAPSSFWATAAVSWTCSSCWPMCSCFPTLASCSKSSSRRHSFWSARIRENPTSKATSLKKLRLILRTGMLSKSKGFRPFWSVRGAHTWRSWWGLIVAFWRRWTCRSSFTDSVSRQPP